MTTAKNFQNDFLQFCTLERIPVIIKPGAPQTKVLGVRNGALHIAIAAPPENGKANRELEKFLSKRIGKCCEIISGNTARKKIVKCS